MYFNLNLYYLYLYLSLYVYLYVSIHLSMDLSIYLSIHKNTPGVLSDCILQDHKLNGQNENMGIMVAHRNDGGFNQLSNQKRISLHSAQN